MMTVHQSGEMQTIHIISAVGYHRGDGLAVDVCNLTTLPRHHR